MILINRTYSECTPESAEDGETSDEGFIWEDVPCTFHELISLLRDHPAPSSSHGLGDTGTWFSTGYQTEDYATGAEREECVHYAHTNPARNAKYWRKAVCIVFGAKRI